MTSAKIKEILQEKNGKVKLYALCKKHFDLVDQWEERLTAGDLLNEYELAQCMERLTGCMMKFGPISGALESQKEFILQNQLVVEQAKFEDKFRTQDNDIAKARARKTAEELGDIATDFRHYFYASQSAVVMAQSRLKRLSVEKSAKGVDFTGEVPNV